MCHIHRLIALTSFTFYRQFVYHVSAQRTHTHPPPNRHTHPNYFPSQQKDIFKEQSNVAILKFKVVGANHSIVPAHIAQTFTKFQFGTHRFCAPNFEIAMYRYRYGVSALRRGSFANWGRDSSMSHNWQRGPHRSLSSRRNWSLHLPPRPSPSRRRMSRQIPSRISPWRQVRNRSESSRRNWSLHIPPRRFRSTSPGSGLSFREIHESTRLPEYSRRLRPRRLDFD